jgi:hypothetical protein
MCKSGADQELVDVQRMFETYELNTMTADGEI